jgi:adenylate cyclase
VREIERKFHVAELPDETGEGRPIRQGYVALDGEVSVRVRDDDGRYVLTIKGGAGRSRTEVEVEVDPERFEALWPLTAGRRLEKRRHRLPLDGLVAELDLFAGDLRGLALVEVEFPSEAEAAAFVAPDWFGEELTGVPGWSNASLAVHGLPDTSRPA